MFLPEAKAGQYENQRAAIVTEQKETVCNQVVQQIGIQCFKCKGFGYIAKECRLAKRVKNSAYCQEKMLMYQELEAHYMYMAKVQEVIPTADEDIGPIYDKESLEKGDSNTTPDSSYLNNNEEEVDQDAENF
ncbi:hypothetical protein Tco_1157491 [Tanacetum coccineum]